MASFFSKSNPNIFTSKNTFVHTLVSEVRANGSIDFWVLNKQHLEIYKFRVIQISDFDITIDLINDLANEFIMNTTFVIHMKNKIVELMDEIPGKVYLKRLDCYRDLYSGLNEKLKRVKSDDLRIELEEKVDYIESTFPELLI